MHCGSFLAYIATVVLLTNQGTSYGYEGIFQKLQKRAARGVAQRKTETTLYEGDIILDQENVNALSDPGEPDTWVTRVIPISFDSSLDSSMNGTILAAMRQISGKTSSCIRFYAKTDSDNDFINITGIDDGCYSSVGRRGGPQILNLGKNCNSVGVVLHELMHALGFWHEQSRSDRDNFVQVRLENVYLGEESNFNKRSKEEIENYIRYDYDSILHYRYDQFSKNGQDTIVPKDRHVNKNRLGQRRFLSEKDVQRIRWLYDCTKRYCPDIRHYFDNGVVDVKRFSVGAQAKYRCNAMFRLVGAEVRTCKSDGTWSGAVPYCADYRKYPYVYYNMNSAVGLTQTTTVQWTRSKGQTPSEDTGPHVDHTNEDSTGWYFYLEATDIPVKATASMTTQPVRYIYNGAACLTFWYYMYGDGMGTVNVYVISGINSRRRQVWSSTGNSQKKQWQMATQNGNIIRLPVSSAFYQIVFEAVRGDKDTSDIGVDDVLFGHCGVVNGYLNAINRESHGQDYGSMVSYASNDFKKFR